MPLDGYHLTRAELSAMSNAEEAHYRRGAAFTFNPETYLALIETLRKPLEAGTRTIHAPSFDHAKKDPVEDDIHIPPTTRIIIIEGLYVALDRPGWREAASLMDEIWFIDIPLDIATERVAKRNFKAGLSPTYEAALERTEKNDMRNAREILAEKISHPTTETIKSVTDEAWRQKEQGEEEKRHANSGSPSGMTSVIMPTAAIETEGGDYRQRNNSQAVVDDLDPKLSSSSSDDLVSKSQNVNGTNGYHAKAEEEEPKKESPERPTERTQRMDSIAEWAAAGGGC